MNTTRETVFKGLEKLRGDNAIPARGKSPAYTPGYVLNNYFYVGDKPGGVEPGFLAIEINQAFLDRLNAQLQKTLPNLDDCKDYLRSKINNLSVNTRKTLDFYTRIGSAEKEPTNQEKFRVQLNKQLNKNLSSFDACKQYLQNEINKLDPETVNIMRFAIQLRIEGRSATQKPPVGNKLDLFLFKQDYDDAMLGVSPPTDRLASTNAMQNIPGLFRNAATNIYEVIRTTSPSNENMNAILECFANDIARAYGMDVQDQYLVFGTYKNNHPKVLTACKWEPQLVKITRDDLHGGKATAENYLAKQVAPSSGQPSYYVVDPTITDKGQCLALFIEQGDRDVFGSQGQNKGYRGNQFFGFDFGHAYRGKNPLIDTLQNDFSFSQPKERFKNISICYDSTLSDRMAGLFFLYKMMDENTRNTCFSVDERVNIAQTIEEYKKEKPGFNEWYNKVEPASFSKFFDLYHNQFNKFANEAKENQIKSSKDNPKESRVYAEQYNEYKKYATGLQDSYQCAIETHKTMFHVFKSRMQLLPMQVDLLDNLEKLSSKTSLTSVDKTVHLSHIRVIPNTRVPWEFSRDNSGNIASLTTQPLDNREAGSLFARLNAFLKDHYPTIQFSITADRKIQIDLPLQTQDKIIRELSNCFSEKNIINEKHKDVLNLHEAHAVQTAGFPKATSSPAIVQETATFKRAAVSQKSASASQFFTHRGNNVNQQQKEKEKEKEATAEHTPTSSKIR